MKQESTAGRESVATTDSRGIFKQAGCWLSHHGAFAILVAVVVTVFLKAVPVCSLEMTLVTVPVW